MSKTIHRVIEGTQSTITVEVEGERLIARKSATTAGGEEVKSQVDFLLQIPQDLKSHYPNLLQYSISDQDSWYTMEYYAYPTMRWLLLFSSLPLWWLEAALSNVVEFLFSVHHSWKREPVPNGYIEKIYVHRPIKRLRSMEEKAPIFADLNSRKLFSVGDTLLVNPLLLFEEMLMSPSILRKLTPIALVGTHGQVEFEHILINLSSKDFSDFILLDPRGVNECLDPIYDAAKIMQCTSGKLDWLEEDLYQLGDVDIRPDSLNIAELTFSLSDRNKLCDQLNISAKKSIFRYCTDESTEVLEMRLALAEASHLLSAVPFCYRQGDLNRAIACYVVGAQRINEFARNWLDNHNSS